MALGLEIVGEGCYAYTMNNNETKRIFIRDLNANDVFTLPGQSTVYVCESRRSESPYTTVTYRVQGTDVRFAYTRPSLSTVDLFV